MRRLCLTAATVALAGLALPPAAARAEYFQTNLISNVPGLARVTDPNLVNPWGVSFGGASPFWVSNQGTSLTSLYSVSSATGAITLNPIGPFNIPTTGGGPQGPTGQVQNNQGAGAFHLASNNTAAAFIFANLNGTISAWNPGLGTAPGVSAQVQTMGAAGTVYTGLAIGASGIGPTLYAANTSLGRIDTFNGTFTAQGLGAGAFTTPAAIAALGFVPFNVQNINGLIYVTYALPGRPAQISAPEGQGAVAVFDLNGNLVGPVIVGSKLASPWGVALAPASFGPFGGDLLVGNFSYAHSEINAFNPTTGAFLGTISDFNGNPILNPGLWTLTFGNGGNGGNPNVLYFTAGLNAETAGLFGSITPAAAVIPEPPSAALFALAAAGLFAYRSVRRRRVV
jgi:uncharacterized protein (TIGR03118 family)